MVTVEVEEGQIKKVDNEKYIRERRDFLNFSFFFPSILN